MRHPAQLGHGIGEGLKLFFTAPQRAFDFFQSFYILAHSDYGHGLSVVVPYQRERDECADETSVPAADLKLSRPTISRQHGCHVLLGLFFSFRADGDFHDVAAQYFFGRPAIQLLRKGIPKDHGSGQVGRDDRRLDSVKK